MPFAMFRRLLDSRRRDKVAVALYRQLVEQSRQPDFYIRLGVPDTLEGRYDLLILHAYLLLRRLGQVGTDAAEEARAVSQATFDLMFADMDQNLRELGVTDTGIGKRVRRMAEAFYGRVAAYDKARDAGGEALAEALSRNLYRGAVLLPGQVSAMVAYIVAQDAHLAGQDESVLLSGQLSFLLPEGGAA
jgi:cytochrome b pre-mRNA-processing protein 3